MTKSFKRGLVVFLVLAILFGYGISAPAADKMSEIGQSDRTGDITIAVVYKKTAVPARQSAGQR